MTKEIHGTQDVHQRRTRFGLITDWLSSNLGIKDKRSLRNRLKSKLLWILTTLFVQSGWRSDSHLCQKTWPVKTISLWAAASYQLLQYLRGCFLIVNWITLSWDDALHWLKKWRSSNTSSGFRCQLPQTRVHSSQLVVRPRHRLR